MRSRTTDQEMNLLKEGADWLGLELTPGQLSKFATYAAELVKWNQKFNLTAIRDIEGIQTKHFLDSLTCFLGFPGVEVSGFSRPLSNLSSLNGVMLMDVGAGAGFPGIPLALARPAIRLALLESARKKTRFLEHVVSVLDLDGVSVVTGRAEDVARLPDHRELYDVVVSRAVADLTVLAEYCLPFTKIGGRFIAPKKGDVEAEIDAAEAAIAALGGKLTEIRSLEIPRLLEQRWLVLIDKVRITPREFPRRAGVPAKHPMTGNAS